MTRGRPVTARGVGVLALAAVCFAGANRLGLPELVAMGVMLLALMVGALVARRLVRPRADVDRTFAPAAPEAGERVIVTVRARRVRGGARLGGEWDDELPPGLVLAVDPPGAGPGGTADVEEASVIRRYAVRAPRRGIHTVGPVRLTITDPFGLVRRRTALGGASRLVVTPAVTPLAPLPRSDGPGGSGMTASPARMGAGSDDAAARPWLPGDSMRRIHWRATAHRDELMVRQEEAESAPRATVVLDRTAARWAPAAGRPGADADFEAAVSLCASVAVRLVLDGFTVAVVDADGIALADPVAPGDRAGREDLLRRLAIVTTGPGAGIAPAPDPLARRGGGPLVRITGALGRSDAAALAGVGAGTGQRMLLAMRPAPGALDDAAGWRSAAAGAGVDPAQAWLLVSGSGAGRAAV